MLSSRHNRYRTSSSFSFTDKTCTVCVCVSVFAWLICGLLFVHIYIIGDSSSSSPSTSSSTQQSPITNDGNSLIANNFGSPRSLISQEFDKNSLWKPIYVENLGVRMPAEQMDAILEKYWIPKAKQQYPQIFGSSKSTTNNVNTNNNKPNLNNNNINNNNKDLRNQNNKKEEKKDLSPKDNGKTIILNSENTFEDSILYRVFPSMNNAELVYPKEWYNEGHPCENNPYDLQCVTDHLQYWKKGTNAVKTPAKVVNKYVTFLKDCGGFNNIRQGFEFHAMVAWLTNRTLVLPPDEPWYLIDRGQITRGKPSDAREDDILGSLQYNRIQGVSNYDIFFEIDDMRLKIPVITTNEFIKREMTTLAIPQEFDGNILNIDQSKRNRYFKWLNEKASQMSVELPWGQLSTVLIWPNIESYNNPTLKINNKIDDAFIDNRKLVEYTPYLHNQPFIHFPSCAHSGSQDLYFRYLGQIARSIAFVTDKTDSNGKQQNMNNLDLQYKQVVRDNLHLTSEIFIKYASKVINILGLFQYTALHVRRNELQYKYVFCSAEESYNNIKQLINEYEVIYIASDESDENYFKIFENDGKHIVLQWKHFFGKNAIFEETKDLYIPPKYHGPMEMIICAAARIFFGTKESTYSSYITRLRGYLNAPYTQTLYHHYKLTNNVDESSVISKSNPGKPYRGQIYKIEFPDLWEDIKYLP